MKFVAKAPREGINVSDEHPLVEAGTLIIGLSAIFVLLAVTMVFFVELVIFFVSPETEARIFSSWAPADIKTLAADDNRGEAASKLLQRLSRHWPDSPYTFRLQVSESDAPNAMAFPGGLIVVTTGLLDKVGSENELAFVLGHELGHFRNRDHLRGLGRGIALGILFAAVGSSEGSAELGLVTADLTLRSFSRDQESQADAFGLEIVQKEYGHVNESWRFFERLLNERITGSDLIVYLSTHPAAANRIQNVKAYAAERDWPLLGNLTKLSWSSAQ